MITVDSSAVIALLDDREPHHELVDAAVIACAERNGGRVLTYDFRHFGVVAGEGTITLVE